MPPVLWLGRLGRGLLEGGASSSLDSTSSSFSSTSTIARLFLKNFLAGGAEGGRTAAADTVTRVASPELGGGVGGKGEVEG